MCRDCQAFAHALERADVLDAAGGTDIVQVAPANFEITEGHENVRCLRLSPKGTIRFFVDCCKTPIGNTVSPSLPFIGVPTAFVARPDGRSLDDLLGPVRARLHANDACGKVVGDAHPKVPPLFLVRTLRLMAGHRLRGRHRPFVLFDPETREPVSPPRVLTRDERRAATPS